MTSNYYCEAYKLSIVPSVGRDRCPLAAFRVCVTTEHSGTVRPQLALIRVPQ